MKITDLEIYTTNEEKKLLDKLQKPCYFETLSEREQQVSENLVRKSLLRKIRYKGSTVVLPNEKS
jgi:hypothetical protein